MVQPLTQGNSRAKDGQPRKRGQRTPQGRANTVASRLEHGIRSRTPVLLHVESEAQWQAHLEGFRSSYSPVGEVEECLVHLIAYQFWRWIARLIPYERDLTLARLSTAPEQMIADGPTSEDIAKVLSTPAAQLCAQQNAASRQLARYEALGNGNSDGVMFAAVEVEELIERVRQRLDSGEEENDEGSGAGDPNEDIDPDDHLEIFDGENRSWTASEVLEQLRILCEAAGQDWRAQLSWALFDYRHELEQRACLLTQAKEHVASNRILAMDALERLCLYERQISASTRQLIGQLERHQARRLGLPVAAPVALDVNVSHHGAQSEIH